MKRNVIACVVGFSFLWSGLMFSMAAIKTLVSSDSAGPEVDVIGKQLEILKQGAQELQTRLSEDSALLEKVSAELAVLKNKVKQADKDESKFLNEEIKINGRIYQNVAEIVQTLRQTIELIKKHENVIKEYKADPSFKALRKKEKTSPTFQDLLDSAARLFTYKTRLEELKRARETIKTDNEKRKSAFESVSNELRDMQAQQKEFMQSGRVDTALAGLSRNQQGDLIDKQLQQLAYKQELVQSKLDEAKINVALLEEQIAVTEKQVAFLQNEYAQVKQSVVIDAAYVKRAEEQVEKKRQDLFVRREQLTEKIRSLLPVLEQLKNNYAQAEQLVDLSASERTALKTWSNDLDFVKTAADWRAVAVLGSLDAQVKLIETQVELLEVQINQAKIDFTHDDLELEILRSWYRMGQDRFRLNADEEIEQEVKRFEADRSQLKAELAELYEKRDDVINRLYKLNVMRDKIKQYSGELKDKRRIFFGEKKNDYQETIQGLIRADEEMRRRINVIGKILEVYATSIAKVRDGIKMVDDVIAELRAKSFWIRSDQSIEWNDVRNFGPDIERFLRDLKRTSISTAKNLASLEFVSELKHYVMVPSLGLLLLLRFLIAFIIFLLLRLYLPDIRNFLVRTSDTRYSFWTRVRLFVAAVIDFTIKHLVGLYLWLLLFVFVYFGVVDNFSAMLFYLFSIPYLLYVAYRFFQSIKAVNKKHGYVFIKQHYQHRFFGIVSSLTYATIMISFFRQAFMLGNYYGSHVPDILFALNIILLQIALIGLISKELILGIFASRRTPISQWLEQRIERYYYIFLLFFIAVVVMINPYVGYGRQVFYVLSRLFITILLLPVFSWIHNRIKRASSDFFFYYSDGSAIKERFGAGKTLYGLFIVVTFFAFLIFGAIVIARVWGYSLNFDQISGLLHSELYSPGIDEVTGKPISVTVLSIFKIMLYVVGGLLVAYVANRFVLRRIFDPLLIGSGVQNTVLTLSRYIIVILALLIGLQSAGLDGMAMKLVVLIGLLSFAVKEPLADFFSYFIILVQRPIKIGDYIKIEGDEEIMGVVRHITPRSTIIRRKNSLTLIVPNSTIITKTIVNWHYARTFCAFGDITIVIPYSVDPERARQIFFEVLDANNNILKNPVPIVWLDEFVEHGFQFTVRGFLSVDKIMDQWDIASQVRLDLVRRLRAEGITIAMPVRILNIKAEDTVILDEKKAAPPTIAEQEIQDQPSEKADKDNDSKK